MSSRTALGLVILLGLLFLGFGCFCPLAPPTASDNPLSGGRSANSDYADQVLACQSSCSSQSPGAYGKLANGSCTCSCSSGYVRVRNSCMPLVEYVRQAPAVCNDSCRQSRPHSEGRMLRGACTCRCEQGYRAYNQSCVGEQEMQSLAPQLCPAGYPVLKYYDWEYKGAANSLYLCYPDRKAPEAENRTGRHDYWNFVADPYSNESVWAVTNLLLNISQRQNLSSNERLELAIAFVQSLPYTFDNATSPYDDYPRYPSETIYADGGDCEDTSILMAAIFERMGYGTVLLGLPHHVAVGVACNPASFNYKVVAYPYRGRDYCYLETTGENFRIGQLPDDLNYTSDTGVEIIPLRDPAPDLYVRRYSYAVTYETSSSASIRVGPARIDNYGPITAKNVKITAALEADENGQVWDRQSYPIGEMPSRSYYNYSASDLRVPVGKPFRIAITVSGDNFQTVVSRTGWAQWR
ncbi:Uncharacterised protein [uncultured archaeon]|nr:Uncharacterised protein [uncultured archaeon]